MTTTSSIGLLIAKHQWNTPVGNQKLTLITKKNLKYLTPVFRKNRSVGVTLTLTPCQYIIIPMTYYPEHEGTFTLSVYSKFVIDVIGQEKYWETNELNIGEVDYSVQEEGKIMLSLLFLVILLLLLLLLLSLPL